jgi:hypothetical protein
MAEDAEQEASNAVAAATDYLITTALKIALDANPEQPEAVAVGALMSVVRFYADSSAAEGQPLIARDILTGLTPTLHRSAEAVAKARKVASVQVE